MINKLLLKRRKVRLAGMEARSHQLLRLIQMMEGLPSDNFTDELLDLTEKMGILSKKIKETQQ